jgi:hypothetical protein
VICERKREKAEREKKKKTSPRSKKKERIASTAVNHHLSREER